jgi:hypothetical protein
MINKASQDSDTEDIIVAPSTQGHASSLKSKEDE